MSQPDKNANVTLEVARRVKENEIDAGSDGERLLQLVDEASRLRADDQVRAAEHAEESAHAVALRIAKKYSLTDLQ